jgi:hypothetical protein
MPDLDRIYDRAFFEEWGPANERYVRSAELIAQGLVEEFRPQRIVDLGCGCGVYAHAFRRQGVEVVAIDGVLAPAELRFPGEIHIRDLTRPFENEWGAFDFALCLEVAEHIPEEFAGMFLDNLTRFSDRLLLSAAPPNQGGHHHVNERPKRYWVGKLAEKGFLYQRKRTGVVMERFKRDRPGFMWMAEHISVYKKAGDGPRDMPPFTYRSVIEK